MKHRPFPFILSVLWLTAMLCAAQETTLWKKERATALRPKSGRGWTITARGRQGHTRLLAYSTEGDWEKAMQNPTFRWILQRYADAAEQEAAPQPGVRMADLPERVEPLLTDLWHQDWPYNRFTPVIGGEHCLTGCVAQAMAQVMRHHRYAACRGSHTYTDSLGCGQTLTAVFPPQGYDFESMLDVYEEENYTEREADAVGRLLSDCGVAVDMQYGTGSSGAVSTKQAVALHQYFGYDAGMQLYYRDYFRQSEWEDMLRRELAAGRPVLMSARSPSLSHAFCCDGYDEEGLFHINLGMAGDADGFYYLPYLTPKQPQWYDPEEAERGMNLLQEAIIGIKPDEGGQPTHVMAADRLEPYGRREVVVHHLADLGWNACESTVGLWLLDGGHTEWCVAQVEHRFEPLTLDGGEAYTDTLRIGLPDALGDGTYRLELRFRETDGNWQRVRTCLGTPDHLLLTMKGGQPSIVADTLAQASLWLDSHSFPATVETNSCPKFSFTLHNGEVPFCGRFYVLLQPEDDTNATYHCIQYQGIYLEPGEQTTRNFSRSRVPLKTGRYNLWLAYEGTLLEDTLLWLTQEPLQQVEVVPAGSGVDIIEGQPEAKGQAYDLGGRPLPQGHRRKGIALERRSGDYRKTLNSK